MAEGVIWFAERGGFEPPIPFRGILAFQASQFNHSCISPKTAQFTKIFFPADGKPSPAELKLTLIQLSFNFTFRQIIPGCQA